MEQNQAADANKVIDILSNLNGKLSKSNAFLVVMVQERDEEIIKLKKEIEELYKKKR